MKKNSLFDWLGDSALFSEIDTIKPYPFIGVDAAYLDRMFLLFYGERELFAKLETLTAADAAKMLVMNYGDKWDLLIAQGILAAGGFSDSRELLETVNNTEARTNTRADVNTVSAFNTDDLLANDGANSDGTDDLLGETIRAVTETNIDSKSAYDMLSLSARDSIIKTVLHDVADYLTLSIY